MALSAIMASLKTALTTVPGVMTVTSEVPAAPAAVASFPAIICRLNPAEIQPSNVSIWTYPIDVIYLLRERGQQQINQDLAALYDEPKAIVDALNAHHTLGGQVYGMQFAQPSAEIGVIEWRDKTFSGCQVHLLLKEKFATSFSG